LVSNSGCGGLAGFSPAATVAPNPPVSNAARTQSLRVTGATTTQRMTHHFAGKSPSVKFGLGMPAYPSEDLHPGPTAGTRPKNGFCTRFWTPLAFVNAVLTVVQVCHPPVLVTVRTPISGPLVMPRRSSILPPEASLATRAFGSRCPRRNSRRCKQPRRGCHNNKISVTGGYGGSEGFFHQGTFCC